MAIDAELHPEKTRKESRIYGRWSCRRRKVQLVLLTKERMYNCEMKSAIAEEVNSFYRGGTNAGSRKAAKCLVNTKVKEIVPEGVLCEQDGKRFW